MVESTAIYPLSAVRALAQHTQGLTTPFGGEPAPTPDAIHNVVEQIGGVQIDTLQVVHRSHYLTVWSRLGCYNPADFDCLVYGDSAAGKNRRRLFEDRLYAACILPLSEYRYRLPHKRRLRDGPAYWTREWLSKPGSAELLQFVLDRIRDEGPHRGNPDSRGCPCRGSGEAELR